MRAVRAIGTLQERQGDQEAIASYVRSGAGEKAEAAADALPEQPAHIDTRLLRGQSRRRATAYMANQAIGEISVRETTRSPPQTLPSLGAFKVLAAMSQLLSVDEADRVIDDTDSKIERPANVDNRTDQAVAEILLSLVACRPWAVPCSHRLRRPSLSPCCGMSATAKPPPNARASTSDCNQARTRSTAAMTRAARDGRSATVMPWEGVRTSNTGPSTGPLTRTQIAAAATRPTANHIRRVMADLAGDGLSRGNYMYAGRRWTAHCS